MSNVHKKNTAQSEVNCTFKNLKSECVYGRLYFPMRKALGSNSLAVWLCDVEREMVKGRKEEWWQQSHLQASILAWNCFWYFFIFAGLFLSIVLTAILLTLYYFCDFFSLASPDGVAPRPVVLGPWLWTSPFLPPTTANLSRVSLLQNTCQVTGSQSGKLLHSKVLIHGLIKHLASTPAPVPGVNDWPRLLGCVVYYPWTMWQPWALESDSPGFESQPVTC